MRPRGHRARALRQARAARASRGEAGHLLGRVVLDVLQAQQAVGDHAVAAHAHVQVALHRGVLGGPEPDRVVGEVPGQQGENRSRPLDSLKGLGGGCLLVA